MTIHGVQARCGYCSRRAAYLCSQCGLKLCESHRECPECEQDDVAIIPDGPRQRRKTRKPKLKTKRKSDERG